MPAGGIGFSAASHVRFRPTTAIGFIETPSLPASNKPLKEALVQRQVSTAELSLGEVDVRRQRVRCCHLR